MTREQMIDLAVRETLLPMWRRHFDKYPRDLSTAIFPATKTTGLAEVRATFRRITGPKLFIGGSRVGKSDERQGPDA